MKNKTLKRVKKMMKPYIKTIIFVTIISIIIDIVALSKPYLVKVLIDNFFGKGKMEFFLLQ